MEKYIAELLDKINKDAKKSSPSQDSDSFENPANLDSQKIYDTKESLIQIAGTIKELIMIKRNFFMLKNYEDFLDNSQYQESLQALESEVRNHIKIEQQLRLFIEAQEGKLEEIEKDISTDEINFLSKMKIHEDENNELLAKVAKQESEITSIKSTSGLSIKNEYLLLKKQAQKESEKLIESEKKYKILTESWAELEDNLEKKNLMCSALKQENNRLRGLMNVKNRSSERDRSISRGKLVTNQSRKNLNKIEEKLNYSPLIPRQEKLFLSKSNINLYSRKILVRDDSIERLQSDRQLTAKRKY